MARLLHRLGALDEAIQEMERLHLGIAALVREALCDRDELPRVFLVRLEPEGQLAHRRASLHGSTRSYDWAFAFSS